MMIDFKIDKLKISKVMFIKIIRFVIIVMVLGVGNLFAQNIGCKEQSLRSLRDYYSKLINSRKSMKVSFMTEYYFRDSTKYKNLKSNVTIRYTNGEYSYLSKEVTLYVSKKITVMISESSKIILIKDNMPTESDSLLMLSNMLKLVDTVEKKMELKECIPAKDKLSISAYFFLKSEQSEVEKFYIQYGSATNELQTVIMDFKKPSIYSRAVFRYSGISENNEGVGWENSPVETVLGKNNKLLSKYKKYKLIDQRGLRLKIK